MHDEHKFHDEKRQQEAAELEPAAVNTSGHLFSHLQNFMSPPGTPGTSSTKPGPGPPAGPAQTLVQLKDLVHLLIF